MIYKSKLESCRTEFLSYDKRALANIYAVKTNYCFTD